MFMHFITRRHIEANSMHSLPFLSTLFNNNTLHISRWVYARYYLTDSTICMVTEISITSHYLTNWWRSIGCYSLPRRHPQKHVPITLVGIPYVRYTYQSYWNVFLRVKSWRRIATYRAASICEVMWGNADFSHLTDSAICEVMLLSLS